jgi:hypothetical protein
VSGGEPVAVDVGEPQLRAWVHSALLAHAARRMSAPGSGAESAELVHLLEVGELGGGKLGRAKSALCDGEVGDNHGVVATGGNAFVVEVCRRIAGVTGANQAGLAVIERRPDRRSAIRPRARAVAAG